MTATAAAVLLLPWAGAALAAEPTPGSSKGGSPGPSAPAGVKVSTKLPSTITVDNKTEKTELTATVTNNGDKATGPIVLKVVGFDALKVTAVEGGQPIPKSAKPPGNGGFSVKIADLAPGKSASYKISATYDLKGKGKICLPVTLGTSDTLLWQQGPVPFGTTNPTPNAPDTPLLLGTDNVPSAAGAGGSPSPSPSTLPTTGPSDNMVPLAVGGVLLLAAGGAGLLLSARRPDRAYCGDRIGSPGPSGVDSVLNRRTGPKDERPQLPLGGAPSPAIEDKRPQAGQPGKGSRPQR